MEQANLQRNFPWAVSDSFTQEHIERLKLGNSNAARQYIKTYRNKVPFDLQIEILNRSIQNIESALELTSSS